jgi:toxin-antitoxin system PIN domain toxin
MILPDVNVLVYALRKDVVQHKICNDWLNSVVQGDARFGISPLALGAVVRVTTDRRIFATPSTSSEAFAFAAHLLAQPHCVPIQPGDRHWHIFERLCIETNTTGRRATDAWYAALAIEWGCEWITFDRDFARFPGLKWQFPSPA